MMVHLDRLASFCERRE